MSNDFEPNLYRIQSILQVAQAACARNAPNEAAAALLTIDGEDLEATPELKGNIGRLYLLDLVSADGRALLDVCTNQVKEFLPRFRIVLIDETDGWTDPALVAQTGNIWSAYLYDENRRVHIADTSPSYEMRYLYCAAENQVSEDVQSILQEEGNGGEGSMTMYCRDVDRIGLRQKHFCGEPSDKDAEDYNALEESEFEYYQANVNIDCPREPALTDVVAAVKQQFEAGDLNAAAQTLDLAAALNHPPLIRMDLLAYSKQIAGYGVEPFTELDMEILTCLAQLADVSRRASPQPAPISDEFYEQMKALSAKYDIKIIPASAANNDSPAAPSF